MHNLEKGRLGEKIAKEYLQNKGYKVLEQNCRNRYGEIDLICEERGILVFVEVKTRTGERFGSPEDALNRNKIFRLVKNAEAYAVKNSRRDIDYRIDAICIVLDENREPKRINHYEGFTA
jgi:putative endonuclease